MRYLMFVATDPEPDSSNAPEPDIEEWFAEVNEGGHWITGDRLRPTRDAVTVRVRSGELLVTDGVIQKLAKDGFDPQFGARPLRRALQHIANHPSRNKVWFTRPGEIYDHCSTLPAGTMLGSE